MLKKTSIMLLFFIIPSICFASVNLSLEESIKMAMDNNPGVLSAKKKVQAAEGMAGKAFSSLLPQVGVQGGIGYLYMQPQTVQIKQGPTVLTLMLGVDEMAAYRNYQATLTQPLFTGGKLLNAHDIARKNLLITKEELRRVKNDIAFQVKEAFFRVVQGKELFDLSNEALNMAKTHLKHVKAMFNAGVATRADILRVEVQVANAEVGVARAKQGYILSKNAFNTVVGQSVDLDVNFIIPKFDESDFGAVNYHGTLALAYNNRPDWNQFLLTKGIADNNYKIKVASYLPDVSYMATYGNNIFEYSSFRNDYRSWTSMVVGSWNIFDSFGVASEIKEARANMQATEAMETDVRNAIALEVKDACLGLSSAWEMLNSAKKAFTLAKENYKIADIRYTAGVGTNIEVIDAQVAFNQAKTEYTRAKFDFQIAKARINKVAGRELYSSEGQLLIKLRGTVFYSDLEGGYVGFIGEENEQYVLYGEAAKKVEKELAAYKWGKPAVIVGTINENLITKDMWGMPFEVKEINFSEKK